MMRNAPLLFLLTLVVMLTWNPPLFGQDVIEVNTHGGTPIYHYVAPSDETAPAMVQTESYGSTATAGAYPGRSSTVLMNGFDTWAASHQLEKKKRYLEAAMVIEPFRSVAGFQQIAVMRSGWLQYKQGNYNKAVNEYKTALWLNPNSIEARMGLTLALVAQKRFQETAIEVQKVLTISPLHLTAHVRLMVAEEGLKQWQKLLQHTQTVLNYYPNSADALVYKARAHLWLGQKAAAETAYSKVLALFPKNAEATNYFRKN